MEFRVSNKRVSQIHITPQWEARNFPPEMSTSLVTPSCSLLSKETLGTQRREQRDDSDRKSQRQEGEKGAEKRRKLYSLVYREHTGTEPTWAMS